LVIGTPSAGPIDRPSSREAVQQVNPTARRRPSQLGIPIDDERAKIRAQRHEFFELAIEGVKPLTDEQAHTSTRRAAFVAFTEHSRELVERKANHQGALNQQDARHDSRRIPTVTGPGPVNPRQ
jgi:hypothetical protein